MLTLIAAASDSSFRAYRPDLSLRLTASSSQNIRSPSRSTPTFEPGWSAQLIGTSAIL